MNIDYQQVIEYDFTNCRKRIKKNVKSGDLRKFLEKQKMRQKAQFGISQIFT